MNCPYCDETVHVMSKFCPKCGLPLKEDATVMGAYASDDSGPGLGMIASIAGGILAVTLVIGWVSSRNNSKPTQQVQRQQIGNPAMNPVTGFPRTSMPMNPALGGGYGITSGQRSANYNPQVRWAYTPPPTPPARPQYVPPPAPTAAEVPTHDLSQRMAIAPRQPARVSVAAPTAPAIPAAPRVPPPVFLEPGQTMPEPVSIETPFGTATTSQVQQLEQDGVITYDPVQEQYVIVPGRSRRGLQPVRSQTRPTPGPVDPAAPRNPALE